MQTRIDGTIIAEIDRLLTTEEYYKAIDTFRDLNPVPFHQNPENAQLIAPLLERLEHFAESYAGQAPNQERKQEETGVITPDAVYRIYKALGEYYLHGDDKLDLPGNRAQQCYFRLAKLCIDDPQMHGYLDNFLIAVYYWVKSQEYPLSNSVADYHKLPTRLPAVQAELESFSPLEWYMLLVDDVRRTGMKAANRVWAAMPRTYLIDILSAQQGGPSAGKLGPHHQILKNIYGIRGVSQDIDLAIDMLDEIKADSPERQNYKSYYLICACAIGIKNNSKPMSNTGKRPPYFAKLIKVLQEQKDFSWMAALRRSNLMFLCQQMYSLSELTHEPAEQGVLLQAALAMLRSYLGRFGNQPGAADFITRMFDQVISSALNMANSPNFWREIVGVLQTSLDAGTAPEKVLLDQLWLLARSGREDRAIQFAVHRVTGNYFYKKYLDVNAAGRDSHEDRRQALNSYERIIQPLDETNYEIAATVIQLLRDDQAEAIVKYSDQFLSVALARWDGSNLEKIIPRLKQIVTSDIEGALKGKAGELLRTYEQFSKLSGSGIPDFTEASLQALAMHNLSGDQRIYDAYLTLWKTRLRDHMQEYTLPDNQFLFRWRWGGPSADKVWCLAPNFSQFIAQLWDETVKAIRETPSALLKLPNLAPGQKALLEYLHRVYQFTQLDKFYKHKSAKADNFHSDRWRRIDRWQLSAAKVEVWAELLRLALLRARVRRPAGADHYEMGEIKLERIIALSKKGNFARILDALRTAAVGFYDISEKEYLGVIEVNLRVNRPPSNYPCPSSVTSLLRMALNPYGRAAAVRVLRTDGFFNNEDIYSNNHLLAFYGNDLMAVYSLYQRQVFSSPEVGPLRYIASTLNIGNSKAEPAIAEDMTLNKIIYGTIYLLLTNNFDALKEQYGQEVDLEQVSRQRQEITDQRWHLAQHGKYGIVAEVCRLLLDAVDPEQPIFNASRYIRENISSVTRDNKSAEVILDFLRREAVKAHAKPNYMEWLDPTHTYSETYWPGVFGRQGADIEAKGVDAEPAETNGDTQETAEEEVVPPSQVAVVRGSYASLADNKEADGAVAQALQRSLEVASASSSSSSVAAAFKSRAALSPVTSASLPSSPTQQLSRPAELLSTPASPFAALSSLTFTATIGSSASSQPLPNAEVPAPSSWRSQQALLEDFEPGDEFGEGMEGKEKVVPEMPVIQPGNPEDEWWGEADVEASGKPEPVIATQQASAVPQAAAAAPTPSLSARDKHSVEQRRVVFPSDLQRATETPSDKTSLPEQKKMLEL